MAFYTASPRVINETPDRSRKTEWTNRRFEYAGRRFVWVDNEKRANTAPQTLWEVAKVWDRPGSKTGKKEHETVGRRVCWGESVTGLKKMAVIHMVGGLDQTFREYILASQLTKMAIVIFGHD
jgi:hypothetical protein